MLHGFHRAIPANPHHPGKSPHPGQSPGANTQPASQCSAPRSLLSGEEKAKAASSAASVSGNNGGLGPIGPFPGQAVTSRGHLTFSLHKRRLMATTTRGTIVLPALFTSVVKILSFTKCNIAPEVTKPPSSVVWLPSSAKDHTHGTEPRPPSMPPIVLGPDSSPLARQPGNQNLTQKSQGETHPLGSWSEKILFVRSKGLEDAGT